MYIHAKVSENALFELQLKIIFEPFLWNKNNISKVSEDSLDERWLTFSFIFLFLICVSFSKHIQGLLSSLSVLNAV